jgi:ribosomal protein S17E
VEGFYGKKKAADSKAQSKKKFDEVKALGTKYGDEKSHLCQAPSSNTKNRRATQECLKSSSNDARNALIGYLVRLHLRRHPPVVMQRMMIAP